MPKKLKGGPFSLSRYGMLHGKRGKTFLVQFARPTLVETAGTFHMLQACMQGNFL